MQPVFPKTAVEVRRLALMLVNHLKSALTDTHGQKEWTTRNLEALRSFVGHKFQLKHFPETGFNQKGAFLWDYIAYQQGSGILIAAESEYDSKLLKLKEDFEKLLYVRCPIKVLIFWTKQNPDLYNGIVDQLQDYMMSCCSEYSPGEVFILYCRTWTNEDGSSGDHAWWMQVDGELGYRSLDGKAFEPVP